MSVIELATRKLLTELPETTPRFAPFTHLRAIRDYSPATPACLRLTAIERYVAVVVGLHTWELDEPQTVDLRTMAAVSGVSRSAFDEAYASLVRKGWVVSTRVGRWTEKRLVTPAGAVVLDRPQAPEKIPTIKLWRVVLGKVRQFGASRRNKRMSIRGKTVAAMAVLRDVRPGFDVRMFGTAVSLAEHASMSVRTYSRAVEDLDIAGWIPQPGILRPPLAPWERSAGDVEDH